VDDNYLICARICSSLIFRSAASINALLRMMLNK
jgi:hypothetical protein